MDDLTLLNYIKDNPCVYNPKHPFYKDCNVRDTAWSEIAQKMNLSDYECKTRWKNIRDTYMRRKKTKIRQAGKRPRRWHLEESLEFMNDVVDMERDSESSPCNIAQVDVIMETANIPEIKQEQGHFEDELPYSETGDAPIEHQHSSRNESPDNVRHGVLKKPRKCNKRKDSAHLIDIFFQSMATTVKALSPQNQIRAKLRICEVVSGLELQEVTSVAYQREVESPPPQLHAASSVSNLSTDDDKDTTSLC